MGAPITIESLIPAARHVMAWAKHVERFMYHRDGHDPDASPHLLAAQARALAAVILPAGEVPTASAWIIAPIRVSTNDGWVEIPGWTNGVLGIDWRAGLTGAEYPCAYIVSHLPTGWSICAITADLPDVMRAADEIATAMDWHSVSLDQIEATINDTAGELFDLIDLRNGRDPRPYMMPAGVAL